MKKKDLPLALIQARIPAQLAKDMKKAFPYYTWTDLVALSLTFFLKHDSRAKHPASMAQDKARKL